MGDVALSLNALEKGLLVRPFSRIVRTGDGYYLVSPGDSNKQQAITRLGEYLLAHPPDMVHLRAE